LPPCHAEYMRAYLAQAAGEAIRQMAGIEPTIN